ncbi:imidazole glycerol phosphate synthase subunit HisH [Amylibacter sp.]|nr:imidazole glycerol phosphate synthase subunit HisH [Amylibacter sp.]MDC1414275.1 imidazole glycerol phosphate synthase subunit HisH [Amylibacter sp.]
MTPPKIAIIDYGLGNTYSVLRAIESIGLSAKLTCDRNEILSADFAILPGVGAYGKAMERLTSSGLDSVVKEFVKKGNPFLGICVGMQLLTDNGEEFGNTSGLGIIPGNVTKINLDNSNLQNKKTPIIGWKKVQLSKFQKSNKKIIFQEDCNTFYFVHSYQANINDKTQILATYDCGDFSVTAAIEKDNVTGVQFHPERSSVHGQLFLQRFLDV